MYTQSTAPKTYSPQKTLVDIINVLNTQYSSWIKDLLSEIVCVTADECRFSYKQNEPRTVNSNPHPNASPRKPQPYGMQFYTLHESQTKLWLSFSPTIKNFIDTMGLRQTFPQKTNVSTAVLHHLLFPFQQGAKECPRLLLADGWFGSLEAAHHLAGKGVGYIMRVNKNTRLLPHAILGRVPTTHNEYIHYTLQQREPIRCPPVNVIRSGFGKSNTLLSSMPPDDKTLVFHTKRTVDGKTVDIHLTTPQAIYKLYANAADISNSYGSYYNLHHIVATRIFKTRLVFYFLNLFISQTRTVYNIIHKDAKDDPQFYRKKGAPLKFLLLFANAIRYTTFIEHHYPVPRGYLILPKVLNPSKNTYDYDAFTDLPKADQTHSISTTIPSPQQSSIPLDQDNPCVGCSLNPPPSPRRRSPGRPQKDMHSNDKLVKPPRAVSCPPPE